MLLALVKSIVHYLYIITFTPYNLRLLSAFHTQRSVARNSWSAKPLNPYKSSKKTPSSDTTL